MASADSAWKALTVVNDWIKHADTKAGATIAASGVLGGLLYALVKDRPVPWPVALPAVACALLILLGGAFAAWALRPRFRSMGKPASELYFRDVASEFPDETGGEGYQDVFQALLADDERLVRELAWQVWANSHTVRRKFELGGRGLSCVLLALPLLAVTAILAVLQ